MSLFLQNANRMFGNFGELLDLHASHRIYGDASEEEEQPELEEEVGAQSVRRGCLRHSHRGAKGLSRVGVQGLSSSAHSNHGGELNWGLA